MEESRPSTTRPKSGPFSHLPPGMFLHRCNQCHQLFRSKSSEKIIAQNIPAPEPTGTNSVDASNHILLFQELAMETYTISSDDPKVFNMRHNVKWQDILSLQKFSLEANLTESLGNSLLEMISEITNRNGSSHIPLPESWRTVPKAVGRKLKSSAVVSSLNSNDVSHCLVSLSP